MPKVTTKKKCCQDKPRCVKCPVVLIRMERMGFAEKHGKRDYKVSAKVPRKALLVARAT